MILMSDIKHEGAELNSQVNGFVKDELWKSFIDSNLSSLQQTTDIFIQGLLSALGDRGFVPESSRV